jgi:DNA transformation protein
MRSGTTTQAVTALKGLGPKCADALLKVGIATADELRARDPFDIYAQLKANVPGASLNFLYAIIGAQESLHWQEVQRTRRTEILLKLEEMGLAPK